MNKISKAKYFTRGGQITLHNFRMMMQIMNKVFLLMLILFILSTALISVKRTNPYERYLVGQFLWAKLIVWVNPHGVTELSAPDGALLRFKFHEIVQSPFILSEVKHFCRTLLQAMLVGLLLTMASGFLVNRWLIKWGASQTDDLYKKGDRLIEEVHLEALSKRFNSNIKLGSIFLPYGCERQHMLFHGSTGTGKSTYIKSLLEQIRKRGDRAIIYDKSCNYLEEFFHEGSDILLNPLDQRTESWHLWLECRDSADFDSLAAAQIPMPPSSQDPFWVNAARTIFSTAAYEMRNDPERNVLKLLRYLLTADLERLQTYLKGTVAETLVSDKIEKTAISIKSVLATYLKSMKYIKDEKNPFSIRQWIQNDEASNWLFITSLGDRHETLKPLMTMWLDIAVNTILSLPRSEKRRIWIILDEVYSLHQLPYLKEMLSEARKFGGCAILGIQNYPQLAEVYGHEGARAISSLLNTRVMFREPDPDVAKWSAFNLGESIMEEVREGISYGANTIRDGVSIQRLETRKPLVSFSEIMRLPDLQSYLRLPGDYPVAKITMPYSPRERINTPFVLRPLDEANIKEIDALLEECEKPVTLVKQKKSPKQKQPPNTSYALDI